MEELKDVLKSAGHGQGLGEDFEQRVFAGIKKKKKQRKTFAAAAVFVVFFSAGFFVNSFLFMNNTPVKKSVVATENRNSVKEEVPIMDEVIYTERDAQVDYMVKEVSYEEDNSL